MSFLGRLLAEPGIQNNYGSPVVLLLARDDNAHILIACSTISFTF